MTTVKLNEPVADFTAQATSGQQIKLSEFKGRNVVIYFYPKDSTPGCTTEGQNFRDLIDEFKAANTVIFGVSKDSLPSHENFKEKQCFPFELISDPDEALCQLFDVIHEKNMYGRKYMGVVRSTFLIDGEGVLKEEWRKVKVSGHAEAVLEAAKSL